MTRRMSCAMTVDAVLERRKVVTRRHVDTWKDLKPGDRLTLIEKGMGLAKGEKQRVLAEVEIVDVRVESLSRVWGSPSEMEAEGVPEMDPVAFTYWWADSHGHVLTRPSDAIDVPCRRIEWRYL